MIKSSLWKRIVAGAAAIMLVATMGITARAAEYEGVSEKGSITVHKYSKVTDTGTANLTGQEIADTSGLGTPLQGVGFILYKLTMPSTVPAGETYTDNYTAVYTDGSVSSVTMNFTDGTTGTATATVIGSEAFTDANGEIEFGTGATLEKGYYLLAESTPLTGYTAPVPAIISLPLTNAAGTGYVYDVHVYPKNISNQPITKILDDTGKTYVVGDDVSFTIDAAIRNEEAAPDTVTSVNDLKAGTTYGEMKIMDDLVGGLTYKTSTIYSSMPNGTRRALAAAEYSFTNTDGVLVWALTPTGIDALIAEGAEALKVEVVATVKASDQALTNKASSFVKKANATKDPEIIETPDVEVPTGIINILKVDNADNSALSGAVFAIANNQDGTTFLKKDGTVTAAITNLADLIAVKDDLLLATTGTDGRAVFSGLVCGTSITDYRLVEIQSPTGYQLKEAAINADLPAVADASEGAKKDVTVTNYANGTIDPDNPKFSLPLTGGAGTILFTVIGILIMAATVVLYNRFKKRNNA